MKLSGWVGDLGGVGRRKNMIKYFVLQYQKT